MQQGTMVIPRGITPSGDNSHWEVQAGEELGASEGLKEDERRALPHGGGGGRLSKVGLPP